MNRRHLLQSFTGALALPLTLPWAFVGCASARDAAALGKLGKPAEFWKPLVPAAAWKVLFEEDTEAPQSSPLLVEHRPGTFICAACYLPLFAADKKFESGTGWPSFTAPLDGAVATKSDRKIFFERTEYHCSRCGGHQGHRFDDGPKPAGLRYCNNGLALNFVAKSDPLPALRG